MYNYRASEISELLSITTGAMHGIDVNDNYYESWLHLYSELSKLLDKQLENNEEDTELESGIKDFKYKFAPPYLREELCNYCVEDLLSHAGTMSEFIREFNDSYLGYDISVNSSEGFMGRHDMIYQFTLKVSDEKVQEYRDFYRDALDNNLNNERIYHTNERFIENLTKDYHVSLNKIHRAFRYYEDNVRLSIVHNDKYGTLTFTNLKELGRSAILEMYLHAGKLIEGYEEAIAPGESLTPEELEVENTPYTYPERKSIENQAIEQLINKYPKLQNILSEHQTQEVRPGVYRTSFNTLASTNNRGGFSF